MCGICGELQFNSFIPFGTSTLISPRIKLMNTALKSRGPDAEGFYADGPLQLGHRRLSIIDLSSESNQPFHDSDLGLVIVFNGTIYNYRELRSELEKKGYHFKSQGDTEVILKAYHAWGKSCLESLNGIFAFAIWNVNDRTLFLARDPFGIKPIYFIENESSFRFASTLQALLITKDIPLNLDPISLQFFFHLHSVVPAPRTLLSFIKKVAPGEYFLISEKGVIEKCSYRKLKAQRICGDVIHLNSDGSNEISDINWGLKVKEALWKAVSRQVEACDVPFGVLLSGGLDSTLLVAILKDLGYKNISTFSIGFDDWQGMSGNEFEYSDLVVKTFQTKHERIFLTYKEMFNETKNAIMAMSEPMVSTDVTAFYILSRNVSKSVKVALCGQGADEVFGGYYWYPLMSQESGAYLHRFDKHYLDRPFEVYQKMLSENYRLEKDYVREFVNFHLSSPDAETFMDALFKFDVECLMVEDPVKRVDNMTMAHGLEARVPFLDKELVSLALQIPPEVKIKNNGKYPLKLIAKGLIPEKIIDRPKGYFPVHVLQFLKGDYFESMRDVLNSKSSMERGLFEPAFIREITQHPMSQMTPLRGNTLWHMALLEMWLQENKIF